MSEPIRAEWATGRQKPSLSLVLFLLGLASLAVSLIVGAQIVAAPRIAAGLGRAALLIPAWGFIAVILALITRRRDGSAYIRTLSMGWLLIALVALYISNA